MKLGEICAKWGDLTKPTFRNRVRELGVVSEDEKIDLVFNSIDSDGGGSLDEKELRDGLKMLIDSAKRQNGDVSELEKQARMKRKVAAAVIRQVAAQEQERLRQVKEEEERQKRKEEERRAKERAEQLALEEAKAQAEAKKRAEKLALLASMGRAVKV